MGGGKSSFTTTKKKGSGVGGGGGGTKGLSHAEGGMTSFRITKNIRPMIFPSFYAPPPPPPLVINNWSPRDHYKNFQYQFITFSIKLIYMCVYFPYCRTHVRS